MAAKLIPFLRRKRSAIGRRLISVISDSSASFLLEAMIASTIFMTVSSAVLIGASATQRARGVIDRSAVAENTARNQMESIFASAYQTTTAQYSAITPSTSGFTVTAGQAILDGTTDLQKITVTVFKDNKSILVLETLRRNR